MDPLWACTISAESFLLAFYSCEMPKRIARPIYLILESEVPDPSSSYAVNYATLIHAPYLTIKTIESLGFSDHTLTDSSFVKAPQTVDVLANSVKNADK